MKTKLSYFILSMFFLTEQSAFCAKITVINHSGLTINIGQNKIENTKQTTIDISSPFDINFSTDKNNFLCKNIPVTNDVQYTVAQDYKVYTVPSIETIETIETMPFTCETLPPTFKVKNNIKNTTAYVWLGANEFVNIGTDKDVDIQPKSKDTTKFGIHIDINNSTQKIKGDNINIKNKDEYSIQLDDDKVKVKSSSNQSTDCYFVGTATIVDDSAISVPFEVEGIVSVKNSIDKEFTKEKQTFNIRFVLPGPKGYKLENIPALFNVTKYMIKKGTDKDTYVLTAENKSKVTPFVKT